MRAKDGTSVLHIVADGCWRKCGTIGTASIWVNRDGRRRAVRGTESVCAEDEESPRVERLSSAHHRAPPIFDVCTAGERMADDHDVVLGFIEPTPGFVRHRHLFERGAAFEGELREGEDVLVDELGEDRHGQGEID
jgi:hypothetical protein